MAQEVLEKGQVFLPSEVIFAALGGTEESFDQDWNGIFQHAITGLIREELMTESWVLGSQEYLEKRDQRKFPADGLIFTPSVLGIELFCSAHGMIGSADQFADPNISFEMNCDFPLLAGSLLVHQLPLQDQASEEEGQDQAPA